jgi:hypothetical protein
LATHFDLGYRCDWLDRQFLFKSRRKAASTALLWGMLLADRKHRQTAFGRSFVVYIALTQPPREGGMRLRRSNMRSIQLLVGLVALAFAQPSAMANAAAITFNVGSDLSNYFNQTGTQINSTPYVQSAAGGISGGSVASFSGNEYPATAVYSPNAYDLAASGSAVNQSISLFFDGKFQPLVSGANAVRSFRLGLLDSAQSSFETFGQSSVYVEGVYSLDLKQMLLVGRSATNGPVTSLTLAQVPLTVNHWFSLDVAIAAQAGNQIALSGEFRDLGADGQSAPSLLANWDWSYQNDAVSNLTSAYAGFSALAGGGIQRVDNFVVDGPISAVPGPIVGAGLPGVLMAIAGFIGWRRCRRAIAA